MYNVGKQLLYNIKKRGASGCPSAEHKVTTVTSESLVVCTN